VSVNEGDIVEILEQKKSVSWTLVRNPKLDSYERDFQGLIPSECVVEIPYKPRYALQHTHSLRVKIKVIKITYFCLLCILLQPLN